MSRLLMVEDDPVLGESLKLNLELEGYKVDWAQSLTSAHSAQEANQFNLIILDLGLPDGNGLELCKSLRNKDSKIPIIILTAQADEDSVVEGLTVGANDYVKKPFSHKELVARIKGLLRVPTAHQDQLQFGNVLLLIDQRRVFVGDEEISLNRREFDLLQILMTHPGIVVSRESVISKLSAEDISDRTIDSHISHVRSKLSKTKNCSVKIKSEYGVGYRLVNID